MVNREEILNIINESFLSEEDKQILRIQLEREGVSESFSAKMNQLLIRALEKRTHKYEEVMNDFESSYKSIEDEYKIKRQELASTLDKRLDGVDPIDATANKKIFDEHYKNVDTAQASYEKQAKEMFSRVFSSAMIDTL